ncbi:glutathione peroxidase [Clostridium folliculivorans]|uniref:Glutathione peroxidase n=1 Tax=Clostridium folliculivorans TaxID=2886038 RepID=A0A9W5Y4G6_9CLOT|nr:glutathione peroxidase [Clostridium folliculivorans]GKU26348.1 glutathione peroxidase [Clostridium folliculivorans]GKU32097.1 glutathione peroxidase [Clostridium folliculivorans]
MSIYDFKVNNIDGKEIELSKYEGKVLIIVNTATKCGFAPQLEDLQKLYEKYKDKGLEILGFPSNQFENQEPGSNEDVKKVCSINYGVTFDMFEKSDVRGKDSLPLFNYLISEKPFRGFNLNDPQQKFFNAFLEENFPESLIDDSIKWNFTKFLVDRNGKIIGRFESPVDPLSMESYIEALL